MKIDWKAVEFATVATLSAIPVGMGLYLVVFELIPALWQSPARNDMFGVGVAVLGFWAFVYWNYTRK